MKRKKSKSKWMKRKWKYKMLSNKIFMENNKSYKMLRMTLEQFQLWKGRKFKFKKSFHMTDGNHEDPSRSIIHEDIRMSRIILRNFGPWKGAKFKLKEAFHMHDGIHTQDGLNFGYIKS